MRVKLAPYAAVPLRLIVGYGFLAHGFAKWNRGPETFAAILRAIGVPSPQLMAWLTIATEILSGIAILVGAFVPLVSIPARPPAAGAGPNGNHSCICDQWAAMDTDCTYAVGLAERKQTYATAASSLLMSAPNLLGGMTNKFSVSSATTWS
jgi:hypothetical protein